jgi:hypothetical protein
MPTVLLICNAILTVGMLSYAIGGIGPPLSDARGASSQEEFHAARD